MFIPKIKFPIKFLKRLQKNNFFLKMRLKANIVTSLTLLILMLMTGCYKSCPNDKKKFLEEYQRLITEASSTKRLKTDKDWDLMDKKFRRFIYECLPKIAHDLDENESIVFWEEALGYVYVRYGTDLLTKYGQTDQLIIRIKDSLHHRQINVNPAIKRLCREWPVLIGASDEEISDQIKNALKVEKPKKLLGKDSLSH
jgi:hypothetical protein